MPDRGVGVTDTPSAAGVADVRVRERLIGGTTYAEPYVIVQGERVASFKGFVGTFRTLGSAASPQNLFSIENAAGSTVLLAVRRLTVQMDATATLTAVGNQFKTSRPSALPTGGTVLAKVNFDTGQTSSASAVLRNATASDGGAATAITATAGATGWHQFAMRMHTLAGQVQMADQSLIPSLCEDDPIILRAGESLLSQALNATPANNAATNHYIINCMWEEFTLP